MADEDPSERPIHIQGTANIDQATGSEATGVKIERVTGNVHVHGETTPPPSFRRVVLVGVLAFLGAVLINIATSRLPPGLQPYLWLAWPLAVLVTGASIWVAYRQSRSTSSSVTIGGTLDERNRARMLDKIENFWIKGVLEQSLYQIARLELGLEQAPDKIDHPWQTVLQQASTSQTVPAGTPIIKLFDDLDGKLLILGAPGAGTTTLLLELARDLIARARKDDQYPLPLVFNLSTWASKRRPLKEWLVEELNQRYDVPRKLAWKWVEADVILPLLDGLDEVVSEHRDACIEAINSYRQECGMVPLAVCSRVVDYEALTTKLRLQGAIVIQPLTDTIVDRYLRQVGRPLEAVRAALRDDPTLWELMDSPLLLSILALAYKYKPLSKMQASGTPEQRRRQLFDEYIKAMFARRSKSATPNTPLQTTRQLSWLAEQMVAHNQTVFYVERMNASWLRQEQRQRYALGERLGAVLGIVLVVALVAALGGPLVSAPGGPLVSAPGGELVGVPGSGQVGVLVVVLVVVLVAVLGVGVSAGLGVGVRIGLGAGMGGALVYGLSDGKLEVKVAPNRGIHRSARSWLLGGLIGGLLGGLVGGLLGGLIGGLLGGLIGGLNHGGVVLEHYTLRWVLSRNRSLPLRLIPFLDYCADRIFLRKVGGGYIFIHRLLMEHFASLYREEPPAGLVEAQRTTP